MSLIIFLFAIGLAFGSFYNVISLRYSEGEFLGAKAVKGRSHCSKCGKILKWHELIPLLSFIIQKGKCRGCKTSLSLQYPIVELITGIAFVAVPLYFINHKFALFPQFFYASDWPVIILSVIWLFIFSLLLLLTIIDLRLMIIPDEINIALGVLGIINIAVQEYILKLEAPISFLGHYSEFLGSINNFWLNHAVSVLIGGAFFGAIIIFSRGKAMGWGDFKLAVALGVIFSWPDIIMILALSFIVGSLFSLVLIARRKKGVKDLVPFGPFLAIGCVITFFFGFQIISNYFKAFDILY